MGVKEELEALRNRGVASKNASKLKDASGLSTPEAEQNAIKAEQQRLRVANYGKEAESNLKSYNEAKIAVKGGAEGNVPASPAKSSSKATKLAAPQSPAVKTASTKTKLPAAAAPVPAATTSNDKKEEAPAVEEVPAVEDVPAFEELPDMDEVPSLEPGTAAGAVAAPVAPAPINRAERKARRMMEKLGMKKVPGISQVVLKMRGGGARGGVFTIAAPDVYEKNKSYVVFGEARQGGGGAGGTQAQQAKAIQQLAALAKSDGGIEMPARETAAAGGESVKVEEVDDAAVDESGLEEKDISLVATQAGCSRTKAVQALKNNDGDLVNAIMSLTA